MLGCRLLCAQFASDLDEATQRQLALKQAPGQPYSVVQQVALIYTATRTSVLDGVNDIPAGGFRRQVFVGLGKRHVVNSYRGTDARRYRGSWQAYVTARCPSVLQLSLEMASILPSFETPVANEAWIQAWAGICSAST